MPPRREGQTDCLGSTTFNYVSRTPLPVSRLNPNDLTQKEMEKEVVNFGGKYIPIQRGKWESREIS